MCSVTQAHIDPDSCVPTHMQKPMYTHMHTSYTCEKWKTVKEGFCGDIVEHA